jgi:hypothetical protein
MLKVGPLVICLLIINYYFETWTNFFGDFFLQVIPKGKTLNKRLPSFLALLTWWVSVNTPPAFYKFEAIGVGPSLFLFFEWLEYFLFHGNYLVFFLWVGAIYFSFFRCKIPFFFFFFFFCLF